MKIFAVSPKPRCYKKKKRTINLTSNYNRQNDFCKHFFENFPNFFAQITYLNQKGWPEMANFEQILL